MRGLAILSPRRFFFFEKKKQKTFAPLSRVRPRGPRQRKQKFFGSFFQKRTLYKLYNFTPLQVTPSTR
jgi:hypothetical protein